MPRSTPNSDSNGIRLNKYLAQAGVASRRYADVLIERGKVRVNGKTVREMGTIVEPGDKVDVSGTPVQANTETVYLVLHKPAGVVTTMRDPQRRRTIAEMLPRGPRVVPVGRLDYETNGVLLLTNDGDLANRLLHPRYGVEKTYRATIKGRLSAANVKALNEGVVTPEFEAAGAKVRVVAVRRENSVVDVTIHEGRNRQVRKMFEALGHPVLLLTRMRFGPVALGDLAAGQTRPLSEKELAALERHRGDGIDGPTSSRDT
ncbi:MAG TPA: pseudouridine synthase [Candidatus Acidoferrales bacterium]|jgi:23S rRNA pseudouridine2605 synthase|nr:pseudouridine synthase [Candidatus Acidoferrales bacterium]